VQVELQHDALVVTPDKADVRLAPTVSLFLQTRIALPTNFTASLLKDGRVRMQGQGAVSGDETLVAGRKLWLQGEIEAQSTVALAPEHAHPTLHVLYEDEHVLVVNKPANLIMYPGDDETDTLLHCVTQYYKDTNQLREVRHVHRLDRGTTGAVLYAKHGYIARALDIQLRTRQVQRTYYTYVLGEPLAKCGEVTAAIGRDRHVSGRYRVSASGKSAHTYFARLCARPFQNQTRTLVACRLETGRTHQIRVHMSFLGAPVVGDRLYECRPVPDWTGPSIALHAYSIAFYHPYREENVRVFAPFPSSFVKWLAQDAFTDEQLRSAFDKE